MKFYVLSDMPDTCLGMRMAGMEGELIAGESALRDALERLGKDSGIAVIAITEGLTRLAPELITTWKLKRQRPLLVEIPDRLDSGDISQTIARYIATTIGIKIN